MLNPSKRVSVARHYQNSKFHLRAPKRLNKNICNDHFSSWVHLGGAQGKTLFNRFAQSARPASNLEASCGRGIVVVSIFVGRTDYLSDLFILFLVLSLRVLLFYPVSLLFFIRGGCFWDPVGFILRPAGGHFEALGAFWSDFGPARNATEFLSMSPTLIQVFLECFWTSFLYVFL